MQLLDITVREDWEAIGKQTVLENTRVWRWALTAVVLAAALSVLAVFVPALQPYRYYLQLVVAPLVPLILAFGVQRHFATDEPQTLRRVWIALLGGLALLVGAAVTLDQVSMFPVTANTPLPLWFVGALGIYCWGVVAWVYRRRPTFMRRIGFVFANWPGNFSLGAAIGAIFGFHVLITFGFIPMSTWIDFIWTLVYLAGLRSLSEEVLFRGLGLHVLVEGMGLSLGAAMLRLALLAALVYAAPAIGSPNPVAGVCYLVYGVVMSPVLVLLRFRRRSLVPSFAGNLVFGLFILPLVL